MQLTKEMLRKIVTEELEKIVEETDEEAVDESSCGSKEHVDEDAEYEERRHEAIQASLASKNESVSLEQFPVSKLKEIVEQEIYKALTGN